MPKSNAGWSETDRWKASGRRLVYLFLAACAFWVNGYPIRLSDGADILSGTIFTISAAILGGAPAAILVSFAGGLRTYLMWGHPWAIPLMVLEAAFVALFARRDRTPVMTVIVYWALIGIPLVIAVYRWRLGLGVDFVWMIGLADTMAGILGAIAVHMLSTMERVRSAAEKLEFAWPSYSLQSHIWVSALLFGILPLLILLEYAGGELTRTREQESQIRLREAADGLDLVLRGLLPANGRLTAVRGGDRGKLHLSWREAGGEEVSKQVAASMSSLPMQRLLVFSADGKLLYSQPEDGTPEEATQRRILAAMAKGTNRSSFEFRRHHPILAQAARYLAGSARNEAGGYTVVATQPASFAGGDSRSLRKVALVWLNGTILISLILGSWFAARVTRSLQNLVMAMQASLREDGVIGICPANANSEVRLLWSGFQLLQRKLSAAVEEHRVNARQAMEAVNEKSAFMAAVSHELRGPMSSISGVAALMNVPSDSGLPMIRTEEGVKMIARSSRHLISIMDDIADFSRLEAHTMPIRPAEFPLAAAVTDVVEWVEAEARKKSIEVGILVGPEVPVRIVADRTRVAQIMFNLLQNAIKFTDRGQVRIRLERVGGGEGTRSADLQIQVEDTGDGIPLEIQEKVFEPFFHRSTSRATPRAGSGLGLAIVKRLVEQMGGTVSIRSSVGGGTWVTIRLRVGLAETDGRMGEICGTGVFAMGASLARESLLSQWMNLGLPVRTVIFDEGMDWASVGGDGGVAFVDSEEMPGDGAGREEFLTAAAAAGFRHFVVVESFAASVPPVAERMCGEMAVHWISWPPMIYRFPPVSQFLLPTTVAPALAEDAERKPLHILIAEDNGDSRLLLQLALELFGHSVVAVGDGVDVLPALEADHFDAVLLDIEMPLMGGIEVIGLLRSDSRFEKLPVYAVTAHSAENYRVEFLEAGFTGHLAKPYALEEVDQLLLGRRRAAAEIDTAGLVDGKIFLQYAAVVGVGSYAVEMVVRRILGEVRAWLALEPRCDEGHEKRLHALSGSCSLIGARKLATVLRELSNQESSRTEAEWNLKVAEAQKLLEGTQTELLQILAEWVGSAGASKG